MLGDMIKAFMTFGNIDKLSKLLNKIADSEKPDEFVVMQLRELLMLRMREMYPLGALCRIYTQVGTNQKPDHLIVGYIHDNSDGKPLIQVHPINPRNHNDLWSNVYLSQIEVVHKQ